MHVTRCILQQRLNLSFSGCGFLVVYQLGAVRCLLDHGATCLARIDRFGGTSSGSLVATLMAVDVGKWELMLDLIYRIAARVRNRPFRSLTPGFHLTEEVRPLLNSLLPSDSHLRVRNKTFISVTNVSRFRNSIYNHFDSKEELVQCLICSCFIPVYDSFKLPKFRDEICVDGSYTSNVPRFAEGRTIVVTPFSGEPDISPRDGNCKKIHFRRQLFCLNSANVVRLKRAIFPPPIPVLRKLQDEGFRDASHFLQREGWYTANKT